MSAARIPQQIPRRQIITKMTQKNDLETNNKRVLVRNQRQNKRFIKPSLCSRPLSSSQTTTHRQRRRTGTRPAWHRGTEPRHAKPWVAVREPKSAPTPLTHRTTHPSQRHLPHQHPATAGTIPRARAHQSDEHPTEFSVERRVIQPHLPVRLPCYDLVPITSLTLDGSHPQGVRPPASGVTHFRDLTGGVYKARERIHRGVADLRLLATPPSWSRVADPNPN